jgi:hypothetical protein
MYLDGIEQSEKFYNTELGILTPGKDNIGDKECF